MAEVQITEIAKGLTVYSNKHQQNVTVIEVNADGNVVIEICQRDTVPASDLTKKQK